MTLHWAGVSTNHLVDDTMLVSHKGWTRAQQDVVDELFAAL